MTYDLAEIRRQFPSLSLKVNGGRAAFFDGPAGTQVPQWVIDAVVDYYRSANANHGGVFATSFANDAMLDEARRAAADFLGVDDDHTIVFGPNMTTLTFQFSRAIAKSWKPGDEIILSQSDHDANVTPWVLAAQDAGVNVRWIKLRSNDCCLDLTSLDDALSAKTKLVAVGAASNATGVVHPISTIVEKCHSAGALVYVDAVHYAPHALIDVPAWGCDFLVCSAYKFYGPHVGILTGRRDLLQSIPAYKVRPASNEIPDRWMTGTPNFEGIAGTKAAIDYLASLSEGMGTRREKLAQAFGLIRTHENSLAERFLAGMRGKSEYKVWGSEVPNRVSTFSITSTNEAPSQLAQRLAESGIFTWSGNFYAQPLTEALGLEPKGMLRIGFVHYNTTEEVEQLLAML